MQKTDTALSFESLCPDLAALLAPGYVDVAPETLAAERREDTIAAILADDPDLSREEAERLYAEATDVMEGQTVG